MRTPKTPEERHDEWMVSEPDFEDAVKYLIRGILKRTLNQSQIEEVADYLNEFSEGFDPVRDGWVGGDGLP